MAIDESKISYANLYAPFSQHDKEYIKKTLEDQLDFQKFLCKKIHIEPAIWSNVHVCINPYNSEDPDANNYIHISIRYARNKKSEHYYDSYDIVHLTVKRVVSDDGESPKYSAVGIDFVNDYCLYLQQQALVSIISAFYKSPVFTNYIWERNMDRAFE